MQVLLMVIQSLRKLDDSNMVFIFWLLNFVVVVLVVRNVHRMFQRLLSLLLEARYMMMINTTGKGNHDKVRT